MSSFKVFLVLNLSTVLVSCADDPSTTPFAPDTATMPGLATMPPAPGVSAAPSIPGPATMPPAPGVSTEPAVAGAATMPPAPGVPGPSPVPGPATMPPAPGILTVTPPEDVTETSAEVTDISDPSVTKKSAPDTDTETSTTEVPTATTEFGLALESTGKPADSSLAVIYFFSALGLAGVLIGTSYLVYRRHKANSFVLPTHVQ